MSCISEQKAYEYAIDLFYSFAFDPTNKKKQKDIEMLNKVLQGFNFTDHYAKEQGFKDFNDAVEFCNMIKQHKRINRQKQ